MPPPPRVAPLAGRAAGALAEPCRFKPASPTCCLVVLETVTQAGRQWTLWENLDLERKKGGVKGEEGGDREEGTLCLERGVHSRGGRDPALSLVGSPGSIAGGIAPCHDIHPPLPSPAPSQ